MAINSGKYEIREGQLVNKITGVAIPADEPVFVLRGKDKFAAQTLEFYAELAETDPFASEVDKCVKSFEDWQKANPDKVHEPD